MYRSGIANLPLHGGKCPPWLFKRMVGLGGVISETIVYEHGQDGIPEPVDKQRYDSSIMMLREAIENAKLDDVERLHAIKHLNILMEKPFTHECTTQKDK